MKWTIYFLLQLYLKSVQSAGRMVMKVNGNRLSISKAAELLNCSEETIRNGLKEGSFPFGFAVKQSNRWTYIITVQKFEETTGIKVAKAVIQ